MSASVSPVKAIITEPVTAFVGVGANLGFSRDAVMNALADLSRLPQSEFVTASSLYRTVPIDAEGADYINAVAEIETCLSAEDLLYALLAIEKQHGRVRTTRNAPRTLDLDLLLYGDNAFTTPDLIVPHPRMAERAFVLVPLAEIAPDTQIPGKGSITDLLLAVSGQEIERLD